MTFDVRTCLAFAIVGLFGMDMLLWHVYPPTLDQGQSAIVNQINGVLMALVAGICGYYFGSSSGSKAKDEALIAVANPQGETARIVAERVAADRLNESVEAVKRTLP